MAKKDILERLSQSSAESGTRQADTGGTVRKRGDAVTTRVKGKKVVRRRRRGADSASAAEAAADAAPAAESQDVAPPAPPAATPEAEAPPVEAAAPVETPAAPEPAKESAPPVAEAPSAPAPEPAPAAPVEATPSAPTEPAPTAPVEAAPAPAAETSAPAPAAEAAAPQAPSAEKAPAKSPEAPAAAEPVAAKAPEAPAAAAKPAAAKAPAAAKPAPEPAAKAKPDESGRTRFRGLGSAVVVPPPGYDPTNPEAYRRLQDAERESNRAAAATRGRRRVASDSPGAGPAYGAPGGAPGGDRGRPAGRGRGPRGRRGAPRDGMRMRPPRRRKRSGPKAASPQPKAQKRKIRIDGSISVAALAGELSIKAPIIMKKLIEMGMMVTVNEMLDLDTATLVANEFEYEVEDVGFQESDYLQHFGDEEGADLEPRPPVVTIMGHVDHGKTTLLDTIRKARVAHGEAGGITQHIGAYQVDSGDTCITFVDTPGHAAFSDMRRRGANVTDIVVLVVAADDGPQPQTVEAISHAKAAGVPIIVAVNKIDKPGVNPDTVKQRLGEYELIPEEWGGETLFCNVSALKNQGIDSLLEAIALQSEMLDLEAAPERPAEGVVIESKMERGRGPVATVLVQQGTLKKGEHVVIGSTYGKVRAMMDHRGKSMKSAGPSTPVEIFGLGDLPRVGDALQVVQNEKSARAVADHRAKREKEAEQRHERMTYEDMMKLKDVADLKELRIVLKGDVQGSVEALKNALLNIDVDGCKLRILHSGVGNISESDVNLIAASDGLIFGFNVRVDARARKAADEAGVKPELYTVIYDILQRVEGAMKGTLEPVFEERKEGTAEVRAVFHISRIGTIAGCYVLDGKVGRNHRARVLRDGEEVWEGKISSLKRFKDDVREVGTGYECGISLDGFNDIKEGDLIESYSTVEVAPA